MIGHEDCLNTYQPSPTSLNAKCLPSTKPENCIPPAWEKLQEIFNGEKCPTWSWLIGNNNMADTDTNGGNADTNGGNTDTNGVDTGIEIMDDEIFAMKSHPLFEPKWFDSAHEYYENRSQPPSEKYQNINEYCQDLAQIMSERMKKLGYETKPGKFFFNCLFTEFSKLDLNATFCLLFL